jgi:hypothetical protein
VRGRLYTCPLSTHYPSRPLSASDGPQENSSFVIPEWTTCTRLGTDCAHMRLPVADATAFAGRRLRRSSADTLTITGLSIFDVSARFFLAVKHLDSAG